MKKASTFRDMTKDELLLKLKELREASFNLRFQKATGQLENTAQLGKTRKDIGRVMTVLREMDKKSAA
jgi:large subunit ribosomal protein L29